MRTVSAVQSLFLNYQYNYNSSSKYQYQGDNNQLIFTQCGKIGDDEGEKKEKKPKETLTTSPAVIVGKCHYKGNSYHSTQTKLKEDVESFGMI